MTNLSVLLMPQKGLYLQTSTTYQHGKYCSYGLLGYLTKHMSSRYPTADMIPKPTS